MTASMLDAALSYAARGWPVFPCQWQKGPRAKQPLVAGADKDDEGKDVPKTGGLWRATTNEVQIRAWWRAHPRALIGMPTGKRSGVFVIDLDPRDEDVEETQARLVAAVGELPRGPVSRTQSGGRHIWFKLPPGEETPRNSAKRLANIDWRGDGGYVIVPPSVMDDGASYVWHVSPDEVDFPEAPLALLDLVFQRGVFARHEKSADDTGASGPRLGRRQQSNDPGDKAVRAYARAALDRAAGDVANAAKGTRGSTLNAAAFGMAPFIDLGALTEREVYAALSDAADSSGLTATDGAQERDAKIRRGIAAGAGSNPSLAARLDEIRRDADDRAFRRGYRQERRDAPPATGHDARELGGDVAVDHGSPAPSPEVELRQPSQSGEPPSDDPPGGQGGRACCDFALTDLGNAKRFVARFGSEFAYVREWGWLAWDGRRWAKGGAEKRLEDAIKLTIELIANEARELRDGPDDHVVKVVKGQPLRRSDVHKAWAETSQSNSHIACVKGLVLSDLERQVGEFDAELTAINVLNGTLRVSKHPTDPYVVLHPHRREDLITKLAPVIYDPAAACPLFDKYLNEVQPAPDMQRYLDAWGGLSLTGIAVQTLLFLYGNGRNGKSVWVDAVASVAGDYAESVPIETFLDQGRSKKGSDATPDLAALPGVRLLRTSEAERGSKLAESLIKAVTGGEPIRARHLNKDFFSFKPQFKLTIQGNYRPKIVGADEGIWGRLQLVPWGVFLPPERRDRTLPLKLQAEASGILNRLLSGLCDFLDNDLPVPGVVQESTKQYREDMDPLGRFLEACTEPKIGDRVQATEMHRVFNAWARANGETEWTAKGLGSALRDRGLPSKKADVIWWLDIRLTKSEADFGQPKGDGISAPGWEQERD